MPHRRQLYDQRKKYNLRRTNRTCERVHTIKTAFTFSNFGLASTMAVAIMVIIIVVYLVQNVLIHKVILKEDK